MKQENISSSTSARTPAGTRMLFFALVFLLALNTLGYILALRYVLPDHKTAAGILVLALAGSAVPIVFIGWLLLRTIRTAAGISKAAGHFADTSLAHFSTAIQALGTGDFAKPLSLLPESSLPVHSRGEIGEMAENFNKIQQAVTVAAAAFEKARTSLHESYRNLWENSDALHAELSAHKKHENELLQTHKQFEARIAEDTQLLTSANERFERELAGHKRTTEALQRWEQIFQNSGWAAAMLSPESDTILSVNPAFATLHGYHPQELIGQALERIVAPAEHSALAAHATATSEKRNYVYESIHMKRDGSNFPVLVNAMMVVDTAGAPVYRIAYFQDITERRMVEQSLKTSREEAENAIRAKSQFLARMSHELRTPLNVILGFSQLLEMNLSDPEHQENVQHILKAGKHLLGLINEVLDISRIEADKLSLSLQVLPVGETMLSAMALVRSEAMQRKIEFVDQLNSKGVKLVIADSERLQQVFLNLLSNAVKYNKPGGRIIVWCSERGDNRLAVSVTDTGSGIPAEKLTQLFTPFERLGADLIGIEGTGLGLALSKRLVEIMDGTLEVSSIAGEGSTFSVVLPMASSPVQKLGRLGDERLTAREKSALPTTCKLLYIEEDISNLRLLEKLLKPYHKIALIFAQHGTQGLEIASKERPDMILLDLDLSDMAGETVLQKLREQPVTADIPVVAISANTLPRRIEQVLKLGAARYLTKPIDVNKLLVVIGESIKVSENLTN